MRRIMAGMLLAAVLVGCGTEGDEATSTTVASETTGEPTTTAAEPAPTEATEPEVDPGVGSADATADVKITGCTIDEFGYGAAALEVTNNSSKPSDYYIEVAFESPDGSQRLGEGVASVMALQPAQVATETASGFEEISGQITCRVMTVERLAS